MLRVAIDRSTIEPKPAVAQLKRPTCQLCKGGGYIMPENLAEPSPCTPVALVLAALPCGCPAGDEFRRLAAEVSAPICARNGRVLVSGVEVPWL